MLFFYVLPPMILSIMTLRKNTLNLRINKTYRHVAQISNGIFDVIFSIAA